jgi:hypothetical protein
MILFGLMNLQNILKYSANSVHITGDCIACGISLIAKRNNETDSVDPCGSQLFWTYIFDSFSLHFT